MGSNIVVEVIHVDVLSSWDVVIEGPGDQWPEQAIFLIFLRREKPRSRRLLGSRWYEFRIDLSYSLEIHCFVLLVYISTFTRRYPRRNCLTRLSDHERCKARVPMLVLSQEMWAFSDQSVWFYDSQLLLFIYFETRVSHDSGVHGFFKSTRDGYAVCRIIVCDSEASQYFDTMCVVHRQLVRVYLSCKWYLPSYKDTATGVACCGLDVLVMPIMDICDIKNFTLSILVVRSYLLGSKRKIALDGSDGP